jgi:hypothetical protein
VDDRADRSRRRADGGRTDPAPAAGDAPSIKVGAQVFLDYTVQQQPKVTDADGNTVTLNQFEVGRS